MIATLNWKTGVGLPDHTQLPDNDGVPERNGLEIFQSNMLTGSIMPHLETVFSSGDYFIGQDQGIYWALMEPVLSGCRSPDWYFVPDVPRTLDGQIRRSYVMWKELVAPTIILEYASDGGEEERDRTPMSGKFWIYERRIRPAFYGIFVPNEPRLEMYQLVGDRFQQIAPNEHGRYFIPTMRVELGLWPGRYADFELTWLRWWDAASGDILPTPEEMTEHERERAEHERERAEHERERAEHERERAEHERERAEHERERADRFAELLRQHGINPGES